MQHKRTDIRWHVKEIIVSKQIIGYTDIRTIRKLTILTRISADKLGNL